MFTLLENFFSKHACLHYWRKTNQSMHAYTAGKKLKAYMLTLLPKKIKAYMLTLMKQTSKHTCLHCWKKTYAYMVGKEMTKKKRAFNLHTHTATHTSNTQKSILKETAHEICTHPSQSQLSLPFSPFCHLDPSSSWPCCCEGGGTAWHWAWPPADQCQGEGDVGGTLAQSLSPRIRHLGWGERCMKWLSTQSTSLRTH